MLENRADGGAGTKPSKETFDAWSSTPSIRAGRYWERDAKGGADIVRVVVDADRLISDGTPGKARWKQLRADPVDLLLIARIGAYQSRVVKDGVRLTSWGPESAALWEQGARESLAAIGSSAKRIVILRDIPRPPSDVPGCLSEHTKDPQACAFLLTPRSLHPDAGLAEAEARAGGDRVSFADLTGVVCPGGLGTRCPVVTKDGVIKYRDDHHMTITYARTLASALGRAIDAARPLGG